MSGMIGVLRMPREVRFGFGARAAVPGLVAQFGPRVFVVADPFLATTPEFTLMIDAIRASGAAVAVHTDVPPELPADAVHQAADSARLFAPDVVIGYGGGSALDSAKLVSLLVAHGGVLPDYYGENVVPGPVIPMVAIPTTAGTGSEVTPVAVVSDPDRELKVGVSSPYLIPAIAIVDPELTLGAPPSVSAFAGIDAFVHAVESFTAADLSPRHEPVMPVFVGRNALAETLALEAAARIYHALPAVLEDPQDRDARADMALGSLLAGMAFGASGTHLSHAIQYPIGAMTHTPHGLGTGTLVPYVMQATLSVVPERLAAIGKAIGASSDGDENARAQSAVDSIADLCRRIGLPVALRELGVSESDVEHIVDLTMQVKRLVSITPFPASRAIVSQIVAAAIAGDRSRLVGEAWMNLLESAGKS